MTGWRPGRAGLLVIFLFLVLVPQLASGLTISRIVVEPDASLFPDTPVTVSFNITLQDSGEPGFPSENELQIRTDLVAPVWNVTSGDTEVHPLMEKDGTLEIYGYDLNEKETVTKTLHVELHGKAPSVVQTMNKTLVRVLIIDPLGCCVDSSIFRRSVLVISPGTSQKITDAAEELRAFRSHIEDNTSRGIDTSAAEAKYIEAEREIASARARPTTGYAGALDDLNAARTAIDEGESALDKAWAETGIANARVPVNNTDAVIRWFKGNSSTANEPGLDQIVAKRDIAAKYLDAAGDELARGNFSGARANAQEAYRTGNESYHDALGHQTVTVCGAGCGLPFAFIVAGIGAIVIAIVGIFLWKKRK
jgi:hypothetical protein